MRKDSIRVFIFLMIGLWLGFPQSGFTETETPRAGVYTLGEVVVTGERVGVESIGTMR